MLRKLFKYDFIWINKIIIVFYAIGLFFAISGRLLSIIDGSLFFSVLSKICYGTAVSLIISALFNGVIRSWVRFTLYVYKDQSYLTHTLPVTKKDIYLSKVLAGILTALITVIMAIIVIAICYLTKDTWHALQVFFETITDSWDGRIYLIMTLAIFVVLIEIIFIILIGYFGIIVGNMSNKNKTGKSIVYGFVAYIACCFVSLITFIIYGLFDNNIFNLMFNEQIPDVCTFKTLLWITFFAYLIYSIIIYILSLRYLKKGVNIE